MMQAGGEAKRRELIAMFGDMTLESGASADTKGIMTK